jgi:hypothetical protein
MKNAHKKLPFNSVLRDALSVKFSELPINRGVPDGNTSTQEYGSFRDYIGDKTPEELMKQCTIPADKLRTVEDFKDPEQMAAYINVLRDMHYKVSLNYRRLKDQHDKQFKKLQTAVRELDKMKSELKSLAKKEG